MKPIRDLNSIIRLGKHRTFFFDYDGTPLKMRPLTSVEIDEAYHAALEEVDPKVAGLILKLRLNLHGAIGVNLDEIPEWMFRGYVRYVNELDYHLVYHAIKDFYEDVTVEKIKEMKYVHFMAAKVLSESAPNSFTEIQRFLKTKEGETLAELVVKFHQPLDYIRNLIPLQEEFLYYADPDGEKPVIVTKEEVARFFGVDVGDI